MPGRRWIRNVRRRRLVDPAMTVDVGRFGIFRRWNDIDTGLAAEVDKLGYGAIWLGGSPGGALRIVEDLLAATDRIAVATGIVNMWADDAATIGASYTRIAERFPGRFLLGVGIGHPEATKEYQTPYQKMVGYFDELDEVGVPVADRVLAALGPRALKLSATRAAGAHPYLTTPEHTRGARELLGAGPLLAPEQKVVLETDPVKAREIGRKAVATPYLQLVNYTSNLRRLGWTDEDLADGGSDRLVDALAVHGDVRAVVAGLTAHLDAGADHVAIQALGPDRAATYRALAEVLLTG
jgi:probable F420-dependent oxidoreductase